MLEDATFALPAGGMTAPIRTRQGFVILQRGQPHGRRVPPLEGVEPQVQEAIYLDQLQPALRAYLTKAREEAYVDIKAGVCGHRQRAASRLKPVVYGVYASSGEEEDGSEAAGGTAEGCAGAGRSCAEARANAAAKAAAKAAKAGGVQNVSLEKPKKIRREKIRFGQAPRKALPDGCRCDRDRADAARRWLDRRRVWRWLRSDSTATVISTGTGVDERQSIRLAPKPVSQKKTRYTARQADIEAGEGDRPSCEGEGAYRRTPVAAS